MKTIAPWPYDRLVETPESIAVLRFGAFGDLLLTAPALEALRLAWPRTRVYFVVKERLAHLVAHDPHIDEVVPLAEGESPVSLARRLRKLGVAAVLDLHGKLRSRLLRLLLPGLPWVVWHKRDLSETLAVKLARRPARARMPFADRYHAAVERAVGRPLPRGRLRYHLGPDDQARGDRALREAGVDPGRPLLGLSPGAGWETKRWPAERFGELAARALSAGLQVVVQGTAEERAVTALVREAAPGAVDLAGRLDLPALGGVVSRCAAFVANDSGPMHLARGLGVPTLALFGSTDPGLFDFRGHRALFAGVPCSPCSFFGRASCPEGHFRCMLDLSAAAAWQALQPLLEGGRREWLSA
ncbi:MAG: glycosyltransferase family 9 protein [Myxococcales bacterium]